MGKPAGGTQRDDDKKPAGSGPGRGDKGGAAANARGSGGGTARPPSNWPPRPDPKS